MSETQKLVTAIDLNERLEKQMSHPLPEQLPVNEMLSGMADSIKPMLDETPHLVAICSGGVWIAEQLHQKLGLSEPVGLLDITFYRDDFSRVGLNPSVRSSSLPVAIDDRHIILIDDILHTGRTIRAALNELFAWGRPASVVLAVLLDRGDRELPFQAEIVGHRISLDEHQFVKIHPNGRLTYVNRHAEAK